MEEWGHYNNILSSNIKYRYNSKKILIIYFLHISAFVRFFDVTPLGQILNRFSADTNIIDQVRIIQEFFNLEQPCRLRSHEDVTTGFSSKRVHAVI